MIRLGKLTDKLKLWLYRNFEGPKKIDFGLLRISPVESPFSLKERFIPLSRSTIVRKLCQEDGSDVRSNLPAFDDFCRYLDACINNRNHFLLKEIKTGYEHLNPDVEVMMGGVKLSVSRRQVLDAEFWFMQKLGRLLELASFRELTRADLAQWLTRHGGMNSVQVELDASQYELLKVWVLGCEEQDKVGHSFGRWIPLLTERWLNAFRTGYVYRRVAIAVRPKRSDKIELKLFKDLSQSELVHTMPIVELAQSTWDRNAMAAAGGLCALGLGTHFALPTGTGWFLAASHQWAGGLAAVAGLVLALNWHVVLQKRCAYWSWRSDLLYRSLVANNRGLIGLVGDRAHDELFKQCILAYVTLNRRSQRSPDGGMTQRQLENDVKGWAQANCSPDFRAVAPLIDLNLTEAISLLRQLNIVALEPSTDKLTAKSLELATVILGSEFSASNLALDLDGTTVVRDERADGTPCAESYEKISGSI